MGDGWAAPTRSPASAAVRPAGRLLLWLAHCTPLPWARVASPTSAVRLSSSLGRAVMPLVCQHTGAYFGGRRRSWRPASWRPGKRGQGVALVLSGLTIATVIGVPLITAVGQGLPAGRAATLSFRPCIAATFPVALAAITFVFVLSGNRAPRVERCGVSSASAFRARAGCELVVSSVVVILLRAAFSSPSTLTIAPHATSRRPVSLGGASPAARGVRACGLTIWHHHRRLGLLDAGTPRAL